MNAFFTDLNDTSLWGLAGREYLREIAALGPYVVRHLNPGKPWITPASIGKKERPLDQILDEDISEIIYGQGQWHNPPLGKFYHGRLFDLVEKQDVRASHGGYSVAITTWPRPKLPKAFARSLSRFSSVWVPTKAVARVFEAAGVQNVHVLSIPVQNDLIRVDRNEGDPIAHLATGSWKKPDDVQGTVQSFLDTHEASSLGFLHVVTDRAITSAELIKLAGTDEEGNARAFADLPRISIGETPQSTAGWIELLRRIHHISSPGAGDGGFLQRLREGRRESWTSDFEAALLQAKDAAVEARKESDLSLAAVIPFKNRPIKELEATLTQLIASARDIEIYVSDQGSDGPVRSELEQLARRMEVRLVTCAPPEDSGWSLASCRNAGAKAAIAAGADVLFFLDADVLVDLGTVSMAMQILEGRRGPDDTPKDCVTFSVLDGTEQYVVENGECCQFPLTDWPWVDDDGKSIRFGTGNLFVRAEVFVAAQGYDEEFQGYGAEDTDLLARLTKWHKAKWHKELGLTLYHQPHERAPGMEDWEKINEARAMARIQGAGTQEEVNPDGWGEFSEVIL